MARTRLLRTNVAGGSIRVTLDGWGYGQGRTAEEAVTDLVARLLRHAVALRTTGIRVSSEAPGLDGEYLAFLWELGEVAKGGGDVHAFVFDVGADRRL